MQETPLAAEQVAASWLAALTTADLIALGVTVGLTLLAMLVVRVAIPRLLRRLLRHEGVGDEQTPWRHLTSPLSTIVLLLGLWAVAVQFPVPEELRERYEHYLATGTTVLITLLVIYAVIRLVHAGTERYRSRLMHAEDSRTVYVGAIRKIADAFILFVGLMVIMGQLGYQIGPLLASLGVAGLAVALALQDTLSNLFSGLYLAFDRPVRIGDYIILDSGQEGFVEEIGWRNTRLRPWQNNFIIIPNSKLAEAVITNWNLQDPEMSVYVWCGVSYESDLEHVERVAIEVGNQLQQESEGAAPYWEAVVRFKEFGDSNITFVLVLRVTDPTASYRLQHEAVMALHRRFGQEGIEISWPVRKVVFAGGPPPTL